jgi:CRP-like cAMP-binding protein
VRKGEAASGATVETAVAMSLLARMPEGARQTLVSAGTLVRLASKAYFAHALDSPRCGVVVKGMFRIGRVTADGHDLTVFWERPGAMLGLGAALRSPAPSSIQAVTDSTILEIPASLILDLARTDARVGWAITEHLALLVRRAVDEVAVYAYGDLRTRIERRLLEAASRQQAPGSPLIAQVTQDDLAQAVGAARPSVARVLKELRDEGSIRSMYGAVLIVRPDALATARRTDVA